MKKKIVDLVIITEGHEPERPICTLLGKAYEVFESILNRRNTMADMQSS